jgi:lipoyl synthase
VTRDDLADVGASQFARTIDALRESSDATIEVLTPAFKGDESAIRTVVAARPDVYNHNIETVPSLYAVVRPGAEYARSLALLAAVKRLDAGMVTKSGLMLGLGETADEVLSVLADLRRTGCDLLTLGQYLAPSKEHLPVARFVPPEEFEQLGRKAREMGFSGVASAPFVRSSHEAGALLAESLKDKAGPS